MNEYDFQNNRVYQWLLQGNEITTLDAMLKLKIGCLTKRISTLIQEYHVPIHKERVKNTSGRGYHTRYSMVKENRELLKDVPLGFAHKYEDVVFWQIGSEPTDLYGVLNHE
jgi:hypothetical protein